MIEFTIRESMLDTELCFLQWKIEGDSQLKSRKILRSSIESIKNTIVKQEVINLVKRIYAQRINIFNHVGYSNESKLIAAQELERRIPVLDGILNMPDLFTYLLEHIIPHLRAIAPRPDSKYHKSINIPLDALDQFAIKCDKFYQDRIIKRNMQYIKNQGFTNSINQSGQKVLTT